MYDLAIIGGGVNGCGIARDAAGRGLSVLLAEKGDLASGTSSASTKLIHGGLRYLEQYEFRLVREALTEREVLLRMAPHIIHPLLFVLPHHRELRPAILIRLGLFLYDHLGGREILPGSHSIDLRKDPAGKPLKPEFTKGFVYSDCWVDDARLVVLNAMDAAKRGAEIRVRTEATSATREGDHWQVALKRRDGQETSVAARALVNAAGPWVGEVIEGRLALRSRLHIRLVKGSHLVVRRLFDHDEAYIFQNADRRIIFAIPYEQDFTLIGTTDVDFEGSLDHVTCSEQEVAYLCAAASEYFRESIVPADVVWTYAGVRPLYDEGGGSAQELTRDYILDLEGEAGQPPLLNVFGGKITTYRHLSEEAMNKLATTFPHAAPAWTNGASLPGGDIPHNGRDDLARVLAAEYPMLGPVTPARLARSYGTLARDFLNGVRKASDLGQDFGAGLFEREVDYLVAREWAQTADDILWRRTKLGLRLDQVQRGRLAEWLHAHGQS